MNGRQTVIASSPKKMILERTLPGACWSYFSYVCKGFPLQRKIIAQCYHCHPALKGNALAIQLTSKTGCIELEGL